MRVDSDTPFKRIVAAARNIIEERGHHAVDAHVRCVSCGYNLHGMATDASCPECGTAIQRSMQGNRLATTDARWLHTLRLAMLCFIGASFVYLVIDGTQRLFPVGAWNKKLMVASIVQGAWWGQIGLRLGGFWLVTTKEPRWQETESNWSLRAIVRLTTVGLIGTYIVASVLQFSLPGSQLYAYLIIRCLDVVAVAGVYLLLYRLASRIPFPRLAQTSLILGALEILVDLSYLLFVVVLIFTRPAATAHPILQCASCAHWPVGIAVIVLVTVFFVQFGQLARNQASP